MATLTVRIDDATERQLSELAKRTGKRRSDIVRDMLRRHIAVETFKQLRREMMPFAEAAGYLTDEDVFRDVS